MYRFLSFFQWERVSLFLLLETLGRRGLRVNLLLHPADPPRSGAGGDLGKWTTHAGAQDRLTFVLVLWYPLHPVAAL